MSMFVEMEECCCDFFCNVNQGKTTSYKVKATDYLKKNGTLNCGLLVDILGLGDFNCCSS